MSKMAELAMDVQNMLDDGYRPVTIATMLNVPVTWVYDVAEMQQEYDVAEMQQEKGNAEVFNPYNTVNS